MNEKYFYLPRVRLYSDNERDREILKWLEELPSGFKGDGIKDAMWASIRGIELAAKKPTRFIEDLAPPLNSKSVRQNGTMKASMTFDTHELLGDIRQIVKVAVTQALEHHGAPEVGQPENEDQIEALLDDLDMNFSLDDEDEEEE